MSHAPLRTQIIGFFLWLAAALAAGALGAIASVHAAEFYAQLAQPSWAPPAWVFGPVWSTLYVLMGIASWLVWRERGSRFRAQALALYVVQLLANALWSWLFFAWHRGAFAFVDVVVLLVLIASTVGVFSRVNRTAAWLMIPYLGWVSFATGLTFSVWQRNPTVLG